MKKQIFVFIILALGFSCKKYNQKNLPVNALYVISGTVDTIYVNGFPEVLNGVHSSPSTIIISGRQPYGHSPNNDTLFKDMWTGDKLTVSSNSYTAIYYQATGSQGYLVDSSANSHASITIGSNY
jgi:hypothetical protein